MKLSDLKEGQYFSRDSEGYNDIAVGIYKGNLWYYRNSSKYLKLAHYSIAHSKTDFYLSDSSGNRLPKYSLGDIYG